MDDLLAGFAWDDLRRALIALLAGVVYLAAVRLIQRYKTVLDRWLKPSEEVPIAPVPAPEPAPEEFEDEEAVDELDYYLQLKDDPPDPR
ncbi:hypothetical protein DFP74_3759 [Nocardiopsis sp. Huas11]|uniref:hypothetical protein n=1 Tax=Nocardiopsis sp. Huas11 TaxID=2183912 RepID=UPI000EB0AB77|nr:hypothetical protein [Nocardiopsis sp. Huas11]RKS08070.1 hypothetical protein DFP74_3759 [Nocardiopsis sp. Huas11]